MKIVILDGYTLNPGDLSWSAFEQFGDVTIYDRTPANLIVERAEKADIVITNKTPIDAGTITALKQLKYIGVNATGYNIVDIEEAKRRNIIVTNIPAYGTKSVAQSVFALVLEHCNRVGEHYQAVINGEWSACPDFCFTKRPLIELDGKVMGIIGYGSIGKQTAQLALAFGMKVMVYSRSQQTEDTKSIRFDSLDNLLAQSDMISLHCPLDSNTKELINRQKLSLMKKSAFLINTSRGGLIAEHDLADALNTGKIAGAGLDVLSVEPPTAGNPLLSAKNCIITPHIAWATVEARKRLMQMAVYNLQMFISGDAKHVVNA